MTSLVPERMLVFSPSLAATIGLEEAILLHVLSDIAAFTGTSSDTWLKVELARLGQMLPFWGRRDLMRVARSLADKGVLQLDAAALSAADQLVVRFDERDADQRLTATAPPPGAGATQGARLLDANWRPDEQLLQLLGMNHGISRQFALDQLEDFLLYWRERGEVSHSWASRFRTHVLNQWRRSQQEEHSRFQVAEQAPASDWWPSDDALQILERSGINRSFIEDAVPEFVLYWRERGDNTGTWNSKFVAHIRTQWARFTSALKHDQEPRPITSSWQPSEDVFDILRMANIDTEFARELLPEFILFWRDAGTPHRSWNTKFLQHVKYQWATRHHMRNGVNHARQQLASGAAGAAPQSAFERLTDRSWADGIVDDE